MTGALDLSTLTEKQLQALRLLISDDKTRIQLEGGSRSGKSHVICAWILLRAANYPGSAHLVARFVRAKAEKTIWMQTLLPMAKKLQEQGACKVNLSEMRIDFTNGSYVLVDGLEPSRIDGVLGAGYSTIFVNECNENGWGAIEQLFSRLTQTARRVKDGKPIVPKFITDLNPTAKNSWHYNLFHLKLDPRDMKPRPDGDKIVSLHFHPRDNIANLAEGYLETLESGGEDFQRRFLRGEYGSFEGLVYKLNPDVHIVDSFRIRERRGDVRLIRAVDFGFWPDPFVCLWICQDHITGHVIVYREWYQHKMLVRDHAKHIYRLSAEDLQGPPPVIPEDTDTFYEALRQGRYQKIESLYAATVCDHDREDRETLHAARIMTEPADKRKITGVEHLTELLSHSPGKKPVLLIHRSCTNLITEMESYRWKDPKEGAVNVKDRVTVGADDCLDSLRYGAMKLIPPRTADFNPIIGWFG